MLNFLQNGYGIVLTSNGKEGNLNILLEECITQILQVEKDFI